MKTQINLDFTLNSGQVFLWQKNGKKWYGVDGDNVFAVEMDSQKIISLQKNPQDFFRKGDDFDKIARTISRDKIVRESIERFPGLRLLRQDPFQCYITFIASANSSIQKIEDMLQKLCKKFGERIDFDNREFFLFPKPQILAEAAISDLKTCGLGYRTKSIKLGSMAVVSGQIDFDLLKRQDYQTAKASLKKVFGIGDKVADCIMLFSLEKLEAFPLDRWMIRVLQKYYGQRFDIGGSLTEKKYQDLHSQIVEHFGPFAGYSQQFLFKMERDLCQKNWL